jgi:hypothetical protein
MPFLVYVNEVCNFRIFWSQGYVILILDLIPMDYFFSVNYLGLKGRTC